MPETRDSLPPPRGLRHAALLVPVVLFILLAGLFVAAEPEMLRPADPRAVAPVVEPARATADRDASAAPAAPTETVQAPGWIEADPFAVAVSALTSGVVESIEVLEGDTVEAGRVVARLVDEDLRLELRRAEAEVEAARAALAEAEARLAVAERDWAEPVARTRAIETARARLAEAEAELARLPDRIAAERAALRRLEEELARSRDAFRSGAASDIEVALLEHAVEEQQARLATRTKEHAVLEAQRDRHAADLRAADREAVLRIPERRERDLARAAKARAEALLAAAEAERDDVRLHLERTVIRSPVSGVVQERHKAPGSKVGLSLDAPSSAWIVTVHDPTRLQVRADVPLADAAGIGVGRPCEVVVEALPDRTFAGTVTRIVRRADLRKNTVEFKVRVDEPHPIMVPDMLARVRFLGTADVPPGGDGPGADPAGVDGAGTTGPARDVVLVRSEALDGGGRVWAVRQRRGTRGTAEPVRVRPVGDADDSGWIVVRPEDVLRPGDLVIVDPRGVSEGMRIRMLDVGDAEGEEESA